MNDQKSFPRVILILLIVLGGVVGYFTFMKKSEPVEMSSWKSWRTSENYLVVKIPSDWKISQADAGGLSLIHISSPNNSGTNAQLSISIENAADFNGENKMNFATYVSRGGSNNRESKNISLGGLSAVSQMENDGIMAYYADLGNNTYAGIKYSINDPEKKRLEAMITTFNFKPTQTELDNAAIIP